MKFLNPCIDIAFKKIFGSEEHKRVTISFLNSILEYTGERAIKEVQFLNTEQKRVMQGKKDNILDILCTDQSGNRYIVEIQVEGVKEFGKRIVYYGTKTYSMQLGTAQSYHTLAPVTAIAILNFSMFPNKTAYKSIHNLLDIKTHEHDLQELSFAFVELPKFTKQENELISDEDKWIYFLKNITKKDHVPEPLKKGAFEEACGAAERMTWSEEELNAYDDDIIRATDAKGTVEFAYEEGEAKGELKKAKAIAKNLLDVLDAAAIAKITGLTIDEIEQLKKEM